MPSWRNSDHGISVAFRPHAALAVAYFCYYAFLGMATIYFTPWLVGRGLPLSTAAIVGTILLLATTTGQALLTWATRWLAPSRLIVAACLGALGAVTSLVLFRSTAAIMIAAACMGLCGGPCLALLDALTFDLAHRSFGRLRAFGSAGFAFAAVGGGFAIDRFGIGLVVPLECGALFLLFGVLLLIPATRYRPDTARDGVDLMPVLRQPALWVLMLSVATINASHAYYYLFGDIIWAGRIGHGHGLVGLLWSIGIGSEILLLTLFGGREDGRWSVGLMLAGAGAAALRWSVTALDPPFWLLMLLQSLHGLTYAATLLGALRMLRLIVPEPARPGMLGLFAALVHGVVIGCVTAFLGGTLATDSRAGFLFMAALALIGGGGIIALRLGRGWPSIERQIAAGRSP